MDLKGINEAIFSELSTRTCSLCVACCVFDDTETPNCILVDHDRSGDDGRCCAECDMYDRGVSVVLSLSAAALRCCTAAKDLSITHSIRAYEFKNGTSHTAR